MCFVLDSCAFASMFNEDCAEYKNYQPLRKWLYQIRGTSLVIGGSRYRKEYANIRQYYKYLAELERALKLKKINNEKVDEEEGRIKKICKHRNFNDQHLVALLGVSGCRIFATNEKKSCPYIKDKKFYTDGHERYIYKKIASRSILKKANIVQLRNLENH